MILCSGAFDGLHAGHVRYLAAARRLAHDSEPVVVAVAPDSYIRTKGREPRWTQQDRWRTLRAIVGIEPVVQDDFSVTPLINGMKPRLFVKGKDWAGRDLPADVRNACREAGCLIVYVDTDGTHSSQAFAQ